MRKAVMHQPYEEAKDYFLVADGSWSGKSCTTYEDITREKFRLFLLFVFEIMRNFGRYNNAHKLYCYENKVLNSQSCTHHILYEPIGTRATTIYKES